MYICENLALLRKHYVDIAVEEGGEVERAIIELEKKYLPPLRKAEAENESDEDEMDVGK